MAIDVINLKNVRRKDIKKLRRGKGPLAKLAKGSQQAASSRAFSSDTESGATSEGAGSSVIVVEEGKKGFRLKKKTRKALKQFYDPLGILR